MRLLTFIIALVISASAFAVDFVIPELNTKFTALDASITSIQGSVSAIETLANGKILMGNGSNVGTEVTPSGDVTMTNAGVNAIAAGVIIDADVKSDAAIAYSKLALTGSVLEADLVAATSDALHSRRMARATYDFSVDGGTQGTIGSGVTLPDNAIITSCWYDVTVQFTSADDTATIAINIPTDGDVQAAVAIGDGANPYDPGLSLCDTKGTDNDSPATFLKTTAAREISWVIAVQDVTAGKLQLFLEYVISD